MTSLKFPYKRRVNLIHFFPDRVSNRVDGWSQSSLQDLSALPVDVLAQRSQGSHVNQRSGNLQNHFTIGPLVNNKIVTNFS